MMILIRCHHFLLKWYIRNKTIVVDTYMGDERNQIVNTEVLSKYCQKCSHIRCKEIDRLPKENVNSHTLLSLHILKMGIRNLLMYCLMVFMGWINQFPGWERILYLFCGNTFWSSWTISWWGHQWVVSSLSPWEQVVFVRQDSDT